MALKVFKSHTSKMGVIYEIMKNNGLIIPSYSMVTWLVKHSLVHWYQACELTQNHYGYNLAGILFFIILYMCIYLSKKKRISLHKIFASIQDFRHCMMQLLMNI